MSSEQSADQAFSQISKEQHQSLTSQRPVLRIHIATVASCATPENIQSVFRKAFHAPCVDVESVKFVVLQRGKCKMAFVDVYTHAEDGTPYEFVTAFALKLESGKVRLEYGEPRTNGTRYYYICSKNTAVVDDSAPTMTSRLDALLKLCIASGFPLPDEYHSMMSVHDLLCMLESMIPGFTPAFNACTKTEINERTARIEAYFTDAPEKADAIAESAKTFEGFDVDQPPSRPSAYVEATKHCVHPEWGDVIESEADVEWKDEKPTDANFDLRGFSEALDNQPIVTEC